MEALRQYIISVVAAALLCGVLQSILQKGAAARILRLVCGLFLAYTVLSPLTQWKIAGALPELLPDEQTASQAVAAGEAFSRDALGELIKSQTQAYILDKATAQGLKLTVMVTLDEENCPSAVTIIGDASPQERRTLQNTIALDLGIPKENQQWSSKP